MMDEALKPCPLCGSTNITCFAEYDGDSYDNEPVYRAVVACLGCCEEGCDPSYDDEPCFEIEAYYSGDHPLIRDLEEPEDCERVLAEHMAELWNRRAERTCGEWRGDPRHDAIGHAAAHEDDELWCEHCDIELDESWLYCPHCGAKVVDE